MSALNGTCYTYPLRPPVPSDSNNPDLWGGTEVVDYVRFKQYRMKFDDSNKMEANSLYNYSAAEKQYCTAPAAIYLAMPPQITTQYSANYRQVDLGVGGVALGAVGGAKGFDDMNDLTNVLQAAARASAPEFMANTLTTAVNSIGGMMGLQGSVDKQSLEAMTRGRIFNPYTEQIFNNMNFRQHNFSFKMFARDPQEAQTIEEIIHYFKAGAHPRYQRGDILSGMPYGSTDTPDRYADQGDNVDEAFNKGKTAWDKLVGGDILGGTSGIRSAAEERRFFSIPNKFEIDFVRLAADQTISSVPHITPNLHFKIMPSVCSGVTLNYTPDNQYNALKRVAADDSNDPTVRSLSVPAVIMNLSFTEVTLLTADNCTQGY
tara:strand:+ start:560 stop:1684 length:1125 start_codon:yes stop_codon:yes gene_type:complete